jgi:hypothetical protein
VASDRGGHAFRRSAGPLILQDALLAKGVDSTRYVVEGANHGDMTFMGGDPNAAKRWSSQQVMGDVVGFLKAHLD